MIIWYMVNEMASLSITKFRTGISDIVNKVAYGHQRVAISRNGKPACAVISMEDLALLEALENRFDLAAAREAVERNDFEDWDKVKAELEL